MLSLKALAQALGLQPMDDETLTFDWNGQPIDFSEWPDDDYGEFEYTTRDLRFDFVFDLQPAGSEVRIYIVEQPGYAGRPDDGHSTHRITTDDGEKYVCIRYRDRPTNVPDALSWAVYWAEQTGEYILTGRPFS